MPTASSIRWPNWRRRAPEALAAACAEWNIPAPRVLTESGRAMTAHHAVLVVNVSEVEAAPDGAVPAATADEAPVLRSLRDTLAALDTRPVREVWQDAQQYLHEGELLYAQGVLDLPQRARLDALFHAIALGVLGLLAMQLVVRVHLF